MRNRQIHSALDGVVLILSGILFSLLSLVSCKSEVKPSSTPLPPPPLGRNAPQTAKIEPPEIDAATGAPKVAQPVEGGVEGGVVGGVVGGVIGTGRFVVPAPMLKADAAEFNTEEYGRIEENEFLAVAGNPLSTFSVDVDRAAYSNVRRFLRDGQRPPRDAVRIEEMVNYFTYDYPDPSGAQPFSVTTEVAGCPWNERHRLLLVGLQGRRMKTADLPANNLVFLIDVSGSMFEPNKLPLVKQGLELLVNQLRPQDRVAIVVYAGNAGLVLPSTPGSNKRAILSAIQGLEAGGSTAGGAGIKLAYEVANKLQIEFNPARVAAYRLIGYENRILRKEDFNNDAKDAGDIGAGHSVTALYELVPPGADAVTSRVDPLKYQSTHVTTSSPEMLTLKLRYKEPENETSKLLTYTVSDSQADVTAASNNLRFASAVAEFGMLLRNSKHKGDATYDQARQLAQKSLGRDYEGYRRDFLTMIDDAERVMSASVAMK